MTNILEIIDDNGKIIYLTNERFKHIIKHPEMQNRQNKLDEIEITIKKPILTMMDENDITVKIFYKFFKDVLKYLKVIVKYLNGKGFIVSAYFVENLFK